MIGPKPGIKPKPGTEPKPGLIPWPPVIYAAAILISVVLGLYIPLPWIGDLIATSCLPPAGWRCSPSPYSGSQRSAP